MIFLIVILVIILILISVLSFPIRVQLESELVCHINWLFIKIRIRSINGTVKTDVKLFNRKTKLFKPKSPAEKTPAAPGKKSKQKKAHKEVSKALLLENLGDAAISKSIKAAYFFLLRCVQAINLRVLKWDIGINDYYWQGIITGLLHSVPQTENLQVRGNFQENNDFFVVMTISIWKLISAALLLVVRFPYFRAYRLYRRVYLQKR